VSIETGDYKRTVPMSERATESLEKRVASDPKAARAATARFGASPSRAHPEPRLVAANLKRLQWPLLALAIVGSGSYAWFGHGHAARESTEVAAKEGPVAGLAPASSAPQTSDPRNPVVPIGKVQVPATAPQEQVAGAARQEAPTATAPIHPASSPTSNGSPGPREMCSANKSPNVDECVRRVCKSEPRFKRLAACLRLQRQPEPWWKLFKSG